MVTLEDQVKKLEDVLQKFKEIVPDPTTMGNRGEHLHSFGPHNMYQEQENVNEILATLKNKYEKFCTVSSSPAVMKLMSDKQQFLNMTSPLKNCLKEASRKLRETTKDVSLGTAVQKLGAIALEEGLRFDCEQTNNDYFISSDMFYVEVILNNNGLAEDVKLHGHTGESNSCKELINILRRKDYQEFRSHLQELKSRYTLKGDTFIKSKILSSLEVLEEDTNKIMKSDMSYNTVSDCIMQGPAGYILPRIGGKPLQITYCADPLCLLDTQNEGAVKLYSDEDPLPRNIGYSATLSVRTSEITLLPLVSLVTNENNFIRYAKQDSKNSEQLPATFVLNLSKPLPTSVYMVKCLHQLLQKGTYFVHSSKASLDDLIMEQFANKLHSEWKKEEYITILPDQLHLFQCVPSENNIGLSLHSIPFTHPLQLTQIIKILRCQAIYNILFCSCFNSMKCEDKDGKKQFVFDVTASDWNTVTVTFIHPIDDSMSSVDFIVSLDGYVDCHLNVIPGSPVICADSYLKKIVNKCLSLPITMRSLLKKSESYKPELDASISQPLQKPFQRPMKLLMPSLSQIQSGLMSPRMSSPSSFLNFSSGISGSMSPATPLFPFDSTQKHSKKRASANNTPVATPNSDGNKTPSKLKLTLKRKRNNNSEIYEIDQTKSDLEVPISGIDVTMPSNVENLDSLSFVYSQMEGANALRTSHSMFSNSVSFPDLPLENESDIDGLLGIPSEPFMQDNLGGGTGSTDIAGFDLDAITSGGDVNFDVTGSAIDPSALVNTSSTFEFDATGMIDIDSLMNSISDK